jgi:nuclease-like protein
VKSGTRSPLKEQPLRAAGQSVQERKNEVLDGLMAPVFVAIVVVMLAALETWRAFHPTPPQPLFVSALAVLAVTYAGWRFWKALPELRDLRIAHEGERAVGQFLEQLRRDGHEIFHDVLGPGFNVDHIVIGPKGVFTVETKTRSKPFRGNPMILFDGEILTVAGFAPDRDPIRQAKAQAGWLRDLLASSTGKSFAVRPVVLFPGWFVEQKPGTAREVWVLNEKAFPKFLAREATTLAAEDAKLAAFHLAQYVSRNLRPPGVVPNMGTFWYLPT